MIIETRNPGVVAEATRMAGHVHNFYQEGMAQFDSYTLIGEREAKLAALVSMASGLNVVFFGAPGGGKTTLGEHMPLLVEDMTREHIATIPPQSDLTPQVLVGGHTEIEKVTETDGVATTEVISTTIEPIITPETRVIWANEFNRGNPYALNSVLEALESGTVDTANRRLQLDLLWNASTMNPGEKKQGTMEVSVAMASRHAIGALMGNGSQANRDEVNSIITRTGWEPRPDAIRPITDMAKLKAMQEHMSSPEAPVFGDNIVGPTVELIRKAHEVLDDHGIRESDGRLASQNRKIAIAIAALKGERYVREQDVVQAIRFVVGARAGMLTRKTEDGYAIVNEVVQPL